MSLPSDLHLQNQKLLQQAQLDQQQQRQRHQDQQQQLVQQQHRPAAAAARELAADLRAQHVVPGAGGMAGGALRVPAMPPAMLALSSPPLVAPPSPSAAAGHFEHEIPFQELQLGKLLGSGSFGDVFVAPAAATPSRARRSAAL
jgi:hypothetical protein